MLVTEPQTREDFEKYYALRYEVLRRPWGQPAGSERDGEEDSSIHAFVREDGAVLAVGRLQFVNETTSQVRYMAVDPRQQGRGLGKALLSYLENKSKAAGRNTIFLHARENALPFYQSCGYAIKEKSHLLWGQVQHWLMEKEL